MSDNNHLSSRIDHTLERKVRSSKRALFFEKLWPRAWLLIGVLGIFVAVSMAGLWANLTPLGHKLVLGAFALAALAALVFVARTPWPTREAAIRRMERNSGIPHRPASSYEDTLSSTSSENPTTISIWRAHRVRLAKMIDKIRVGRPRPATAKKDPFALRALLILSVAVLFAFFGGSATERIKDAFRVSGAGGTAGTRVDAWVTPPAYTSMPPIMLADGGRQKGATSLIGAKAQDKNFFEIPERSILTIRGTRSSLTSRPVDIALEIHADGREPRIVRQSEDQVMNANPKPVGKSQSGPPSAENDAKSEKDVPTGNAKQRATNEIRITLTESSRVRLLVAGRETATWTFALQPDAKPQIKLLKRPRSSSRGSLKLSYQMSDDYGIASASAKLSKLPKQELDPETAWARPEELKGPRFPLPRPPELQLRLPRANAKDGKAETHLEIGSHPWAGMRVSMTLEATDVAGQVGRSKPLDFVLPQRKFQNPLARAIIEQRSKLIEDSRHRAQVRRALDALTLEPQNFIKDIQVYLALRAAYYRLSHDETRAGFMSVVEHLWHVALRIEDGDLSEAERRLRDAQDKLSKALEEGASDEAIQEAIDELRQALNDYMRQLQKQARDNPMQPLDGTDERNQVLSQQDLERMLREMEQLARSGSREVAQQMLSQLRDLLDQLKDGQPQTAMSEEERRMAMEMMKELGDLVGKQQKLMDDTFNKQDLQQGRQRPQGQRQGQQRGGQQQGQRGGRQGQQGRQGQGRPGQQQGRPGSQRGRHGQGLPQLGLPSQGQGQRGLQDLMRRQSALRDRLNDLLDQMAEKGRSGADNLAAARESMESAEQAMRQGDLAEATQQQSDALENMRKGAQSMAQQMLQNSPQRFGQQRDSPRDPLGRPQRSQGPDMGTSVKVPDEIDMQRAREILEELRRRLGQPNRPSEELDYIERLLRRF